MPIPAESKIRVLLVDDNPSFLSVAVGFLERYDSLSVVGALRGGQEALDQLLDLQPHVVLLDLAMPGLSGMEAIPRLRALMPPLGIVVLTMLDGNAYQQAVLAAGADGFVSKTTMFTDLLPAIQRAAQLVPAPSLPCEPEEVGSCYLLKRLEGCQVIK